MLLVISPLLSHPIRMKMHPHMNYKTVCDADHSSNKCCCQFARTQTTYRSQHRFTQNYTRTPQTVHRHQLCLARINHTERERPPPPPSRSYRLPSRNARDYPQVVCFSQCASVTVWVVQKFSRKLCRAPVLRAGQAVWVGRGRRRMRSNKRARTHTHSR